MKDTPSLTLAIPVRDPSEAAALARTLDAIHQLLPPSRAEVAIQIGQDNLQDWQCDLERHGSQPQVECGQDQGVYDAMNRLAERAKGDRILFLGAGDVPLTGLQSAIDRWEEVDDVLELGGVRIPNAEPRVPRHYPARWDRGLRWRNVTHHQGLAYPTSLFKTFGGFRTEYRVLADYALNLDLWQEGVEARWNEGEDWISAAPGGLSRQFTKALYQEEKNMKAAVMKPGLTKALTPLWLACKARWKRA